MNQDISAHHLVRIITFLDRVKQLAILFDHEFNLIATTQYASDSTEIEKLQKLLRNSNNFLEIKQDGGVVLETKTLDEIFTRNWEMIPIQNNFLLLGEIQNSDAQENLPALKLVESITGEHLYGRYSKREYIDMVKYHYEEILNRLPVYIYWKSRTGHYLGVNRALSSLLARNKISDIIGRTDKHIKFIEDLEPFFIGGDEQVMEGKPILNDYITVMNNHRLITLSLSKYPLYSKDELVVGILGIAVDNTEMKSLQIALGEKQRMNAALQKIIDDFGARH